LTVPTRENAHELFLHARVGVRVTGGELDAVDERSIGEGG
jgi:hypothetical protein